MIRTAHRTWLGGMALALLCAGAAAPPRALAPASGGIWQVARSAKGVPERKLCVAAPIVLGQYQHRGARCARTILSDDGIKTIISYRCAGGGFGRSEMTLLTPRTLRIATQGIAADGPFNYVLHARRVGNCQTR